MKSRASALACVLCVLCVCAAVAFARPIAGPTPSSTSTPQHPENLERAVQLVQRQTHGHILGAGSFARGQNTVYRIKVLTPRGRVKVVQLYSGQQSQSTSGRQQSNSTSSEHHSDQGGV